MFNIREAINSHKPKAYKEEYLPTVEVEPEAHLRRSRIPKIEKHPAEDKNTGHRERLRKQFEKSGFEGFND